MKHTPSIDIIIPTKDSLKFLPRLLSSLQDQNYGSMQVTFVDDGSEDETLEYLRGFAASAPFEIKILDNIGNGPGCARNLGVEYSKADYVTFVDSDDYISSSYLTGMASLTNSSPDIVESLFIAVDEEGNATSKSRLRNHLSDIPRAQLIAKGDISMVTWGKLYKRSFLIANKIRFLDGALNGEDHIFSLLAYLNADKVEVYPQYCYYWCRRSTSITNRVIDHSVIKDFINVSRKKMMILSDFPNAEIGPFIIKKILNEANLRVNQAIDNNRQDLTYHVVGFLRELKSEGHESVDQALYSFPSLLKLTEVDTGSAIA